MIKKSSMNNEIGEKLSNGLVLKKLTHMGAIVIASSSMKGRNEALNALIKLPNRSPICILKED